MTAFSIASAGTPGEEYPVKREDVVIRDPFVLVYEGKYYMYGTGLNPGGYGCVVSEDLENWSAPHAVYSFPEGFDVAGDYWAPECHYYEGSFYLFATYRIGSTDKRGTAVFRADHPLGPFEMISDGPVTPHNTDCIDGTLYVDPDGQPWIVYVGEWTSAEDGIGDMRCAKLSDDLSKTVSDAAVLFKADSPLWTDNGVTDGPFLYTTSSGRLIMLWSNMSPSGYALASAVSVSGKVTGPWLQSVSPLYQKDGFHENDGGHGMIFRDLDGNLRLSLHSPNYSNETDHEKAVFLYVYDVGGSIVVKDQSSRFYKLLSAVICSFFKMINKFRSGFSVSVSVSDSQC
ncbi:MAG: family 43 glycosylhydrolase [Clostridia bacterium]|nr:family 43 glycosylhydrolase [Clostridia bacterium]